MTSSISPISATRVAEVENLGQSSEKEKSQWVYVAQGDLVALRGKGRWRLRAESGRFADS
jgi:hypothetical protein